MATRGFFVGGNWKMNGSNAFVDDHLKLLTEASQSLADDVTVVIAPPALYLSRAISAAGPRIEVSAQNCWKTKSGAVTGEMSADMAIDVGCKWTLVGHSERRQIFHEEDALVGEKIAYALSVGSLGIIACIGETLEQREAGETDAVVRRQMEAVRKGVGAASWDRIVIAYEPVWAIGTGKTASPEQAQEVHANIRKDFAQHMGEDAAAKLIIIYGGSVNASNCKALARMSDIDGFLVGGASLKPDFVQIMNARQD